MVIHLELDILESEVKWALVTIIMNKATGGDGIPAELFKILKDDAVKVLHTICRHIWTFGKFRSSLMELEKVRFHFNPKEAQCQRMFKLP